MLCENCAELHKTFDVTSANSKPLFCDVCFDSFIRESPEDSRTICKNCTLKNEDDLQNCLSCDELFLAEFPEQEVCNLCMKSCVRCGTKYWDDSNRSTCLGCSDAVQCANCGDLNMKDSINSQGYCENCASRMLIHTCLVDGCIRNSDSSSLCEMHKNEYKICPNCDKNLIHLNDIVCDECVNT